MSLTNQVKSKRPLKLNSQRRFLHVGILEKRSLKTSLKLFVRVRVSDRLTVNGSKFHTFGADARKLRCLKRTVPTRGVTRS